MTFFVHMLGRPAAWWEWLIAAMLDLIVVVRYLKVGAALSAYNKLCNDVHAAEVISRASYLNLIDEFGWGQKDKSDGKE